MKIVLIGNDERHYAVVRKVVSELDFLYDDELKLVHFNKLSCELKEEIRKCDDKKVYIININLVNKLSSFNLTEYIRKYDWNSEIIILKDNDAILENCWNSIRRVFDIIDCNNNYESLMKDDIKLICSHSCKEKKFSFKNRDIHLNIYFEKILYIYRDTGERKVMIVTDNNVYNLNIGLKDTFYLLDKRFRQVHRACVVNTMRTEKFDWSNNSFTLDNGEEVNMLSKHYKDNVSDVVRF